MSDYPEHERLKSKDDAGAHSAIIDFLDFLDEQGWQICSLETLTRTGLRGQTVEMEPEWFPVNVPKRSIVARFFEIDEKKWEAEKNEMLDRLREANR